MTRTEYFDGEFVWASAYGSFMEPMIVLQHGENLTEILFFDIIAQDYVNRYMSNDAITFAKSPAGWHQPLWQGAGVAA